MPKQPVKRAALLKELTIRRELGAEFVNTTANYDRDECLPQWARQTVAAHRGDRREHDYSYERLAGAKNSRPVLECAFFAVEVGINVFHPRVTLRSVAVPGAEIPVLYSEQKGVFLGRLCTTSP